MNISELMKNEETNIKDYFRYKQREGIFYDFSEKQLTSIKGLPNDFNEDLDFYRNELKNLEGLPENFNSSIFLCENPIESLNGLNDILSPKNILGLDNDFIVREYIRLGKAHLLI